MLSDSSTAKHQDVMHEVEHSGPAQGPCSPQYMSVIRPSVHADKEGNVPLEGFNALPKAPTLPGQHCSMQSVAYVAHASLPRARRNLLAFSSAMSASGLSADVHHG